MTFPGHMKQVHALQQPKGAGFLLVALSLWLLTAALISPASEAAPLVPGDPRDTDESILGPNRCAECHTEEFEVWKNSGHETASRLLTRSKSAKAMGKALGIRRIKSDSRCTTCHFTMQVVADKSKALAGVSCESCHGAAEDWLDLHQDFGSKGSLIEDESKEHRDKRLGDCDSAGMVRTGKVHRMAGQCFACHVIDDEELVDVAGHPTGDGFELVAWSQGEIRHNFIRGKGSNASAEKNRLRMLFIAGQMQELNYSMQALAKAKGGGSFEAQTVARAKAAMAMLQKLNQLVGLPEVDVVLAGSEQWSLAAGCLEQAKELAMRVEHCSQSLERRADGSEFGALDSLLPSAETYRGQPAK